MIYFFSQLRSNRIRRLFAGGLMLAGVTLPLSLVARSSLTEKSPFLPPDFQAPGTAPTQSTAPEAARSDLSLNGVFQIAGRYRFNIHDRQAGRGTWVGENDASAPYLVTHYDREIGRSSSR